MKPCSLWESPPRTGRSKTRGCTWRNWMRLSAQHVRRSAPGEASAIRHTQYDTASCGAEMTVVLGGGSLHHPNAPATTPEMNMCHMRGPAVFRQATRAIEGFLERFFCKLGGEREEI